MISRYSRFYGVLATIKLPFYIFIFSLKIKVFGDLDLRRLQGWFAKPEI